jgi:hypothetical protein
MMKNASQKARKVPQETTNTSTDDQTELDRRYGQIGISAVAAAVRYQGIAKNPAYAPVPTRWQERGDEAA